MVCLDTSVLVALIRKDQAALNALEAEAQRGGTASTTAVNLCELYAGGHGAKNPAKELSEVDELIARLDVHTEGLEPQHVEDGRIWRRHGCC